MNLAWNLAWCLAVVCAFGPAAAVAEDYAHIARAVPSVYWWVGVTPATQVPTSAPDNHSDLFFVDEAGIQVGLRSLLHVAVDYLQAPER